MAPIVRVKDLRKVYRIGKEKVVALDRINLEIEQGEVVSIVGPSGSGKSTLLNQLAGLEKPTKGDVYIGRHNVSKMNENALAEFRQKYLGFVFQSYNLLPALTAEENVALPLMFKGMEKKERTKHAREQLKRMDLLSHAKHKPTEMSGGQQQRVGIARAFVGDPKVIFADEPTGNLDSRTTKQVMDTMLSYAREKGITFIMVTHDNDLAKVADRIVTIRDGRVLSDHRHTPESLPDVPSVWPDPEEDPPEDVAPAKQDAPVPPAAEEPPRESAPRKEEKAASQPQGKEV